jgi:hypothetical protein
MFSAFKQYGLSCCNARRSCFGNIARLMRGRRDAESAPALHGHGGSSRTNVSDDAHEMLAKKVLEHLELSGFEIDEAQQVMTKRPPTHGHG